MTMLLSQFPNQYNANIVRRMVERFGMRASTLVHQQYFTQGPGTEYQYVSDMDSSFVPMGEWQDGVTLPVDSPEKMGTYTQTQARYGLGFKVGPMIYLFGRVAHVQRWADSLIDSAINTVRTKHASVLNNAYSTSYTYRESGVSLVSASHTTSGAGTRSNILAAATALNFDSYDALRQVAGAHVDFRGKLSPIGTDQLIVPDELMVIGKQIMGSPQEPFTTDNQINPFFNSSGLIVEPYLTSATAWFQRDSLSVNMLSLMKMPFQLRVFVEDDTESLVHYGTMIFSYGADDWQGLLGSAGA